MPHKALRDQEFLSKRGVKKAPLEEKELEARAHELDPPPRIKPKGGKNLNCARSAKMKQEHSGPIKLKMPKKYFEDRERRQKGVTSEGDQTDLAS